MPELPAGAMPGSPPRAETDDASVSHIVHRERSRCCHIAIGDSPDLHALADEFSSALLVYEGGRQELPSGTPGDPAMDFQSSGRRGTGVCGAFQPGRHADAPPFAAIGCPCRAGCDAAVWSCHDTPNTASGSRQPYELCPDTPGDLPPDGAAQSCCRHFAFCVPYSRFATLYASAVSCV